MKAFLTAVACCLILVGIGSTITAPGVTLDCTQCANVNTQEEVTPVDIGEVAVCPCNVKVDRVEQPVAEQPAVKHAPVRRVLKARPLARLREAKPVRRVLGRLFGRR